MQTIQLTPADDLQRVFDSLTKPATVYLARGVYKQKVEIRTNNLVIVGDGPETTVLTYGDYAKKPHPDGRDYTTFRSYTLCVTGENVILKNLTVENSNTDTEKSGQCVALSVNSKRFRAENVDIKSTQDTLFCAPFPDDLVIRYSGLIENSPYYAGFIPKRQLFIEGTPVHVFDNCRIYGTVDYVFGCARAFFKSCEFISLKDSRGVGYVAAPAHALTEQFGFTFIDCAFSSGGAAEGTCYLARPWRDFGKCNFINCRVGSHISPLLFDKWNQTYRDKTARFAYRNVTADFDLTPVEWSKELSSRQAEDILIEFKRS